MSCHCERPREAFLPVDSTAPFFAYGIFMPGEIAFFQIAEYVAAATQTEVPGLLRARDGVPVLDAEQRSSRAMGWRLTFAPGTGPDAYGAIGEMEPKTQYRWDSADGANVLVGRSPQKGSDPYFRDDHWSSWSDSAFDDALKTVERLVGKADETWDGFFQMQAACLLLWSSIERYTALRYGLGRNESVMKRLGKLVNEESFCQAVAETDVDNLRLRPIFRSDDPKKSEVFVRDNPAKALNYLYQVRSNASHRGKNPRRDTELMRASTTELLRIFRSTLTGARQEAARQRAVWS